MIEDGIIFERKKNIGKNIQLINTIMKQSLKNKLDDDLNTDNVNDNDGWKLSDIHEYLDTIFIDENFEEEDDAVYQINILLSRGWRSGDAFHKARDWNLYNPSRLDSGFGDGMPDDTIIYGISLLKMTGLKHSTYSHDRPMRRIWNLFNPTRIDSGFGDGLPENEIIYGISFLKMTGLKHSTYSHDRPMRRI